MPRRRAKLQRHPQQRQSQDDTWAALACFRCIVMGPVQSANSHGPHSETSDWRAAPARFSDAWLVGARHREVPGFANG
jgi:hypothetical protein